MRRLLITLLILLVLKLLVLLVLAPSASAMRVGVQPNSWNYEPVSWGHDLGLVQPQVVRLEVDWTADWATLDHEVSQVPPRASLILLPLGGRAPQDPQAYATRAAQMASRYGASIEVWNEPNSVRFWGHTPSVDEYSALLDATDAATTARVIMGAPWPSGSQVSWTQQVLARTSPDAVAIHPYASLPSGVEAGVREIRAVTSLPLVVTEFGWGTPDPTCMNSTNLCVSEAAQAAYLRESLARLSALGYVTDTSIYYLRDTSATGCSAWDCRTGLFRGDGSPKPSFYAVRNWLAPSAVPPPAVPPPPDFVTLRIGPRHRIAKGRSRGCARTRVVIRRGTRKRVVRTQALAEHYRTSMHIRHHGRFRVRARCGDAASRVVRFRV